SGGDIETHAECRIVVELERAVDLVEVEVRADLDRAIARVAHRQPEASPAGVDLDRLVGEEPLAWNHRSPTESDSRRTRVASRSGRWPRPGRGWPSSGRRP